MNTAKNIRVHSTASQHTSFGPFDQEAMLGLSAALASLLPEKLVIYLLGDLGAGKTTFSRGLLQSWGHQGAVKSPTFTLVEPYALSSRKVYHFDLYRLAEPDELEYLGAREYFSSISTCLIEWPCLGGDLVPEADLVIEIIRNSSKDRVIEITASPQLLEGLRDILQ